MAANDPTLFKTAYITQVTGVACTAIAGNNVCLGNVITTANFLRVPNTPSVINSAILTITGTFPTVPTAMDLYFFNAVPTSTITSGNSMAIAAADFPKLMGMCPFVDYTAINGATSYMSQVRLLSIPFNSISGSIFTLLVNRTALDITSCTATIQINNIW